MKKAFTLIALFAICKLATAQTNTPVNSSYEATSYIDVYPYSSVPKDKVDKTIHFKLNSTKFTVVKMIDSAGTNLGYVILPWRYADYANNTAKKDFYEGITGVAQTRINDIIAKGKNIKDKESEIKVMAAALRKDSINIEKLKKDSAIVDKDLAVKGDRLYNLLLRIDAKNALILPPKNTATVKNKLNNFTGIRSQLLSQFFAGDEDEVKTGLIDAALQVPFNKNIYFNKYSVDYLNAKSKVENINKRLDNAKEDLNTIRVLSKNAFQELNLLKMANSQQSPGGGLRDTYNYRVTKHQINDVPDASPNPDNQAALYGDLAFIDSWANGWQFFISAKDLADHCVPIHSSDIDFTWGFLTLPVKMRFDNNKGGRFDFEQNLNFGITFGIKQQFAKKSDMSLNYLAGLSVVSVPIDADKSSTAISPSLGAMFQYDKFQIGAFVGVDIAGPQASSFKYQGKPWLGIAIGVSLFGEHKTAAPKDQSQ